MPNIETVKYTTIQYVCLAALAAGMVACTTPSNPLAASEPAAAPARRGADVVAACSGRIEGASETVEVGAGVSGVIKAVYVREGDVVRKGAPLAEIDCSDTAALLRAAMSEAESGRQLRTRLLRGSREEEREIAAQRTAAARADFDRATLSYERLRKLFDLDEVPRSNLDDARRDRDVADANLKEALRHEQLVNAPPLPEEVAKADADVSGADSRVHALREQLNKCLVTAPADGAVLRLFVRPGESFSIYAPRPLLALADTSVRRVRAEIDERDLASVRLRQKALVFSNADQNEKFEGTVERIAASMGRKKILSSDPAEKTDHDVLEAIVLLPPAAQKLPLGMRVVVQFLR